MQFFRQLHEYMINRHQAVINNAFYATPGFIKRSPFSVEASTENLLLCVDVLNAAAINYRIVFGTLLGLHRDGSLISHDLDVDIALPTEVVPKFITALPKLEAHGFAVVRYAKNSLVSLGRRNNYVDFYLFKREQALNVYKCGIYTLSAEDFSCSNMIQLAGRDVLTVANPTAFCLTHYGADWRVPIAGLAAHPEKHKGRVYKPKKYRKPIAYKKGLK